MINDKLYNIRKELEQTQTKCAISLEPFKGKPDLVHIIRRSYSMELQDDPRNLVLANREPHTAFDDDPTAFSKYPGAWDILKKMKDLDERYYLRYISRIND